MLYTYPIPSGAFALAVLTAVAAPARGDDFSRDFGIDPGVTMTRPAPLSIEQAVGDMGGRTEVTEQRLGSGLQLSSMHESRWPLASDAQPQRSRTSFSLLARDEDGAEVSFGIGGLASQHFGVAALHREQGMSPAQDATLAHPYFSLVPAASHASVAGRFGGLKLRVGVLSSGLNQALVPQEGYPVSHAQPEASAGMVEVSRSFGDAALSVSLSQTRETNTYLGSWGTPASPAGSRTSTSALQLAGAFMIAPRVAIAGQAAYGVTSGGLRHDNQITEISTARTNAFSVALVAEDRIKRGDRLSVSLSQPVRTYSGRIVMDVLSRSSGRGAGREHLALTMVPIGREMRIKLHYQMPAGYGATFGLTMMARRNPNNLDDARVEALIAIRYMKPF